MWKQAPSSAAACSFLSRRGRSNNIDDDARLLLSQCDDHDFDTSVSRASLVHLTTILSPSPVGCQGIEQLIKHSLVAPSTLRFGSAGACRLDHEGGEICSSSAASSSPVPVVVDGWSRCRGSSSSHRQQKPNKTRWKLLYSAREPAAAPPEQIIIISQTVNPALSDQANSRCLTTPESRQIDDMQTDSSSLVDLSTTSLQGRELLNAPCRTIAPRVQQKVHYMNYSCRSQRKKRKILRSCSSSFGSSGKAESSCTLPLLGSSPRHRGSSAVECLTSQESSSIPRTTSNYQDLEVYQYYDDSLLQQERRAAGSTQNLSPGTSDLTSEPPQFPMADQEEGSGASRSSSVDEVVGPLRDSRSRGSSPAAGPPDPDHPVQEQSLGELPGSISEQSLPPSEELLESRAIAYSINPLPPAANVEPSSSHGLELAGSSSRSAAGPEREFYPQTAAIPLALETRGSRELSEIPKQEIHQTQAAPGLGTSSLPAVPAVQQRVEFQGIQNPSSSRRGLVRQSSGSRRGPVDKDTTSRKEEEAGPSTWLQLRLGTTSQIEASGSAGTAATLQQEADEAATRRLDPPPVAGETSSSQGYTRRAQQPTLFSPSFQSHQDPGPSSARRLELGTTGAVSELDPSAFLVPQVLPPHLQEAYGMLFPQEPATSQTTSSQQVVQYGVTDLGRFPFLERRGDDVRVQPAAGLAGHNIAYSFQTAGEAGPAYQSRTIEFFQLPRRSSVRPVLSESEELFFGSQRNMMQSSGEAVAGPSTTVTPESFGRPARISSFNPQRPSASSTALLEQLTSGLPWPRDQIPAAATTSTTRGVVLDQRLMSSTAAAALDPQAPQGGLQLPGPQGSWFRLLQRVGPTNVPSFRVPSQPPGTAPTIQDIHMQQQAAAPSRPRAAAPPLFHSPIPGSTTSSLQPWNTTRLDGVDAGGDVASSSSRLQQTQLQLEQARPGGHITLPAQPGSSWDSPVLRTFISLSPDTAAGPSRSGAVLQRLSRSSNIAETGFKHWSKYQRLSCE
ncbi:hypothetical protein CY35_10G064200 [Sphagnum magellanicum]|nr:hypothetical protein CY35_10G064200 [Sphagnum magellanicum]